MSSRIIPLTALSVVLVVIFWAVVATAQQPIPQPLGQGQPAQDQYGQQQPLQPISQQQLPPQQQPLAGQPQAGPVGPVPVAEYAPQPLARAPFTLSPEDEAILDRLLADWQKKAVK